MSRVHQDGWAINGCPDDGPAMAVDAAGTVHLVWPTLLNGTDGTLLYATAAAGKTFGAPDSRADTRQPEAVAPAGRDRRRRAAGDRLGRGPRRRSSSLVGKASIGRDGPITFGPIETLSDGPGSYPVVAAVPDGMVAVWTSGPPDRSVIGVRVVK